MNQINTERLTRIFILDIKNTSIKEVTVMNRIVLIGKRTLYLVTWTSY